MPLHDWPRVDGEIFHGFHLSWIAQIKRTLNGGVLPDGFYALAEPHAGRAIADVLKLGASPAEGGISPADTPPQTRQHRTLPPTALGRRRSLAIRHISGHRLIALVEIVSPANKDRARHVADFAAKAASALDFGVHVLLVDLFSPGPHDPSGMHGSILREIETSAEPYDVPADEPATLASYAAGPAVEIFVEHIGLGAPLPEMPLFLRPDRYVNVPLEPTYQAAYAGMPAFWRDVLERGPS